LRANSELKSQQHSAPVLDFIFLRFSEVRFTQRVFERSVSSSRLGSRVAKPAAYAEGIICLPAEDTAAKKAISARKNLRGWTAYVQGNVI
jgi:hypothetical protein